MSANPFLRAERRRVKLKIGVQGPAGSGKTEGALQLATHFLTHLEQRGLAERRKEGPQIAVIDSENDTASLYADRFTFDTCSIYPPYTSEKYIELMRGAVQAGYQVLVIDTLSHQWAGDGGILQRKDAQDARGGNHWTNWEGFTAEHNRFVSTLLTLPIHVIGTLRSKVVYESYDKGAGKSGVRKVGTAPITREGMDYEFSLVWELQLDHLATSSKDRTGLFPPDTNSAYNLRDPDVAGRIVAWLAAGGQEKEPPAGGTQPPARLEQVTAIRTMIAEPVFSDEERAAVAQVLEGITERRAATWITKLEEQLETRRRARAEAAAPGPAEDATAAAPMETGAEDPGNDAAGELRLAVAGLLVNAQIPLRLRRTVGERFHGTPDLALADLTEIHDQLTAALPGASTSPAAEAQPA